MKNTITNSLAETLGNIKKLDTLIPEIESAARLILDRLSMGGKIIIMGNGGSAADAQHIAAELVGRFETDHIPIPAVALTTNTSILTAVANDFGFDEVYIRQMMAVLGKNDVVLAISTSGESRNVNKAVLYAREKGAAIIALSGKDGGHLKDISDICLVVPSHRTCRIQECHIIIGHILCEIIEEYWQAGNLEASLQESKVPI